MLQARKHSLILDDSAESLGGLKQFLTFLRGSIRRQFAKFIFVVITTMVMGCVYLATAPSIFKASATMVIDTRKGDVIQQTSVLGEPTFDTSWIQTQIEAVKSKNVSLAVIRNLKLTEDPDFMSANISPFSKIFSIISKSLGHLLDQDIVEQAPAEQRALEIFDSHRTVNRVGLTYNLEVSAYSHDPKKAAAIANAICNAFVSDQLQAKYEATRQT
jgi:succinoglycan biosynthesis transport protein ExoP